MSNFLDEAKLHINNFFVDVYDRKNVHIIGAFLFGYCLGYYSFDILKCKNRKHDIDYFFSSYNKKYGMQHRIFDRKNGRN